MKKRAIVCGVGNMGKAIIWAMSHLGFHVIALDKEKDSANKLPSNMFDFLCVENQADLEKAIILSNPDVVISSLPYHQTLPVAIFCIRKGYNYCDLGGRVDLSNRINDITRTGRNKNYTFTDLGLAPGWVNILAEYGCQELLRKEKKIKSVKMMAGGLPTMPFNPPMNYLVSWSVDGLLNEYEDNCKILMNGVETRVAGLDGLETVKTKSLGELEAFYTSGGASHSIESMKNKNVENCSYKTLRYKGHCDLVKFLIRGCKLNRECLVNIFNNGCKKPENVHDLVIIKVEINSENEIWEKEMLVSGNSYFSGMQKATSFPISSIAKMMAEGLFTSSPAKGLSYQDINYEEFSKNIETLRLGVLDAPYERS